MAKKKVPVEDYLPKSVKELSGFTKANLQLDEYQTNFVDAIINPDKLIVFCNSKAGTGKTTLAVGAAQMLIDAGGYQNGIYYIASPTQEVKQGFLPGTINKKSEPYFEPFYEALHEIGVNKFYANYDDVESQKFGDSSYHAITHTYVRGRNLKNSVVIIDEAQNYYNEELKKVLTRCKDSCKVIVIGHTGQCDLVDHPERSGFARYIKHFSNDERCSICTLIKNYRGWISSKADELEF